MLLTYSEYKQAYQSVQKIRAYGIKPRNAEQSFALKALLDDDIRLITLAGKAGTGLRSGASDEKERKDHTNENQAVGFHSSAITPKSTQIAADNTDFHMNFDDPTRWYGIVIERAEDRQRVSLSKFIKGTAHTGEARTHEF